MSAYPHMRDILDTHAARGEDLRKAAIERGHDMACYLPQPETGFPMSLCLLPACSAALVLGPRGQVFRNDTTDRCRDVPELYDWERGEEP